MPKADRTVDDMKLYSMAVGVGCPGGLMLAKFAIGLPKI